MLTGNPSTHTVSAVKYSDFFVLPIAVFNEVRTYMHARACIHAACSSSHRRDAHAVTSTHACTYMHMHVHACMQVLELNHGMRKLVDSYAERKRAANKKQVKRVMKRSSTQASLANDAAKARAQPANGSGRWLKLRMASKVSHSLGGTLGHGMSDYNA